MSLRDQLASKKPRTTSATFPTGDAGEKAAQEYSDAQGRLEFLKLANARRKDGQEPLGTTGAEADIKKALARYKKASVTLRFRGLTPTERDRLASEFTPAEEDVKVDLRPYTCALLALAALDSDLTAADWDVELYESGRWSAGEVEIIRDTARAAYSEVAAPGIPKD